MKSSLRSVVPGVARFLVALAIVFPLHAQTQEAKLTAGIGAEYDLFGSSVSLDGQVAIVGAPEPEGPTSVGPGYAGIYRDEGNGWQEEVILTASNGAPADEYGHAVAIQGDLAVVGAPRSDSFGFSTGAVYVYRRVGSTWQEEQILLPSVMDPGQFFGWSVDIDGDAIVVGVPFDDAIDPTNLETNSGAAYVYRYDVGTLDWTEEAYLVPGAAAAWDQAGFDVAIDGDVLVMGAPATDDACGPCPPGDPDCCDSGVAYVYRYDSSTLEWIEETTLTDPGLVAYDLFGRSVALSGEVIVVGAPYVDVLGPQTGEAFVYRHDGSGWQSETALFPSSAMGEDFFAWDVAIDGDRIVVGIPFGGDDVCQPPVADCNAGSLETFLWSGSDWELESELTADDGSERDQLGFSVAVSGDAVLAGSPADDDACGPCPVDPDCCNSGSAYLFGFGTVFLRGDASGDGTFNGLTDGFFMLNFQFAAGPTPPCMDAADANGDSTFNGLTDGIYALNHQFLGGEAPPAPYPACGGATIVLGCDTGCP